MLSLKPNDCIGFFSPSTPITAFCPKRLDRAVSFLKGKGFNIKPGNLTGKKDGYRSGTIEQRADELNELIRDPEIQCIISTIGGTNSNSLLPFIDYPAFKKNPKIVVGHSDVTAILMAIYAKTGMSTFYGPALLPSFGEFEPYNQMTWTYFSDICSGDITLPYTFTKPDFWTDQEVSWEDQTAPKNRNNNQWITLKSGRVEGRLIIGNLNTITSIWGSPYMPVINPGDILFIEDTQKTAAMMERLFAFLKINGVFARIGGLILGKHERFDDQGTGKTPFQILEEVLGNYDFPFLAEVDCSHTHPMFTIPIGCRIFLDSDAQKIQLLGFSRPATAAGIS